MVVMARIMSVQHRAIIMNTVRGDILPPKVGAHILIARIATFMHGNIVLMHFISLNTDMP